MKYLGKDPIPSKPATDEYRRNWDRIFGKRQSVEAMDPRKFIRRVVRSLRKPGTSL